MRLPVLALAFALLAPPAFAAPLPALEGRTLAKTEVSLPADLPAGPIVVVFPFKRGQQAEADTWIEATRSLAADRPGLEAWEVVVMKPVGSVLRAIISGGMRSSVKDEGVRSRWVNVFSDPVAFRTALGIPADDERLRGAVIVGGEVRLVGTDGCDAQDLRALREALGL